MLRVSKIYGKVLQSRSTKRLKMSLNFILYPKSPQHTWASCLDLETGVQLFLLRGLWENPGGSPIFELYTFIIAFLWPRFCKSYEGWPPTPTPLFASISGKASFEVVSPFQLTCTFRYLRLDCGVSPFFVAPQIPQFLPFWHSLHCEIRNKNQMKVFRLETDSNQWFSEVQS